MCPEMNRVQLKDGDDVVGGGVVVTDGDVDVT